VNSPEEPIPITTLTGPRITLGPLRREFVPAYCRWSNDLGTSRTLGLSWPATLEEELARYEQRALAENATWFTLYERASGRPIGLTYLYEIEPRHARANFGILIGEGDCRGKGYGTEATRLLLDYAFTAQGLHSVQLEVFEYNLAGMRAYQKAGFRELGRRRQAHQHGPENRPAQALLSKLGMQPAGTNIDGWPVYLITREAWLARIRQNPVTRPPGLVPPSGPHPAA
jgi:RimJ/RimL family protein N-acetyltransferase